MPDCNTQPLLFSNLKNKKIQADFSGGFGVKRIGVGKKTLMYLIFQDRFDILSEMRLSGAVEQ